MDILVKERWQAKIDGVWVDVEDVRYARDYLDSKARMSYTLTYEDAIEDGMDRLEVRSWKGIYGTPGYSVTIRPDVEYDGFEVTWLGYEDVVWIEDETQECGDMTLRLRVKVDEIPALIAALEVARDWHQQHRE